MSGQWSLPNLCWASSKLCAVELDEVEGDMHTGTGHTTGKELCTDGHKLRRRPNIGAVGVACH
jgi:hypothetical protein